MSLESLVIWLFIGGIAGWLAGEIWKGSGFGLVGNILVGIVGSAIASFLLNNVGFSIASGIPGAIINAVIGAVLAMFAISLVKRAT
jgi:uncharacterized membrane protein YeaQ/YmgE (transglycosylase-associated protein family)